MKTMTLQKCVQRFPLSGENKAKRQSLGRVSHRSFSLFLATSGELRIVEVIFQSIHISKPIQVRVNDP